MLIYVNITDRQTDRQTHQNYSSEPHKKHAIYEIDYSSNQRLMPTTNFLEFFVETHISSCCEVPNYSFGLNVCQCVTQKTFQKKSIGVFFKKTKCSSTNKLQRRYMTKNFL